MKENEVFELSKNFAIRVIKMYKFLTAEKKEYVLSKQILRSGTSIGANISEAQAAFSKKDFLAKMYISFKECNETIYWLDLLYETEYLTEILAAQAPVFRHGDKPPFAIIYKNL